MFSYLSLNLLEPRMDAVFFIISVGSNSHESARHSWVWNSSIVCRLMVPEGILIDVDTIISTLELDS